MKNNCNSLTSSRPAITSQKERYGSVDGERGGGLRLHDVCGLVGLLDDDCRDSGVGRKECHPVHKISHFQSLVPFCGNPITSNISSVASLICNPFEGIPKDINYGVANKF